MIPDNTKTSLLIPYQLPAYIRDDPAYGNFVLFLQAYYEWMEQNGQALDRSKNLLSYKDVDETTNEFIDYFVNDFLPYFPEDALLDKRKAIKIARQLASTNANQGFQIGPDLQIQRNFRGRMFRSHLPERNNNR